MKNKLPARILAALLALVLVLSLCPIALAAEAETVSASARQVLDRMTPDFDRFREGVSFGRNFGRFGWLTGDKVSSYSSGDGLLANRVLSSGGLLRQYVTSPDGKKPWRLDFRFTGTPDPATAERLNALPTVGENAEVEFGYDPELLLLRQHAEAGQGQSDQLGPQTVRLRRQLRGGHESRLPGAAARKRARHSRHR